MKHLAGWRVDQRGFNVLRYLLLLCIVLFQSFPIFEIWQERLIFLRGVVIPTIMGFPDDVSPLPLWGQFGGSWEVPSYKFCYS